jgi:hypothetical protein
VATRVSLGFGRLPDTELDNFAQGVIDALAGNTAFPTPQVIRSVPGADRGPRAGSPRGVLAKPNRTIGRAPGLV